MGPPSSRGMEGPRPSEALRRRRVASWEGGGGGVEPSIGRVRCAGVFRGRGGAAGARAAGCQRKGEDSKVHLHAALLAFTPSPVRLHPLDHRAQPVRERTRGDQPSSSRARETSAYVASTSPGGTGLARPAARGPSPRRARAGARPGSMGAPEPRLYARKPGRAPSSGGEHAAHDVVDVREVAAHRAVAEDRDGPPREDGPREQRDRHLGPLARAVDGEEAQRCDAHLGIVARDRAARRARRRAWSRRRATRGRSRARPRGRGAASSCRRPTSSTRRRSVRIRCARAISSTCAVPSTLTRA